MESAFAFKQITLTYDRAIADEQAGRPFAIESLRSIQLSKPDVLQTLEQARKQFTLKEWTDFLNYAGWKLDSLSSLFGSQRVKASFQ